MNDTRFMAKLQNRYTLYSSERTCLTLILELDTHRAMQNSCKLDCSNLLFTQIIQILPPTAKLEYDLRQCGL